MIPSSYTRQTSKLLLLSVFFVNSCYALSLAGTELNDPTVTFLLLVQAFVLVIVLILYRQQYVLNRELKSESRTDYLTYIPNRRYFFEQLEANVALAVRHNQPLALLIVDIDFFKKINDTHGHATGDKVLKKIAQCLTNELRKSDVVGRIGGEEFGVQLPVTETAVAKDVAERLRLAVASLDFSQVAQGLRVTCSIGVACYSADMTSKELANAADLALYQAKASGRNCVRYFAPDNREQQKLALSG